jgi:hypothetical protein
MSGQAYLDPVRLLWMDAIDELSANNEAFAAAHEGEASR